LRVAALQITFDGTGVDARVSTRGNSVASVTPSCIFYCIDGPNAVGRINLASSERLVSGL
jgi:hypothetical protein